MGATSPANGYDDVSGHGTRVAGIVGARHGNPATQSAATISAAGVTAAVELVSCKVMADLNHIPVATYLPVRAN